MIRTLFIFILALLLASCTNNTPLTDCIIPKPTEIKVEKGSFSFDVGIAKIYTNLGGEEKELFERYLSSSKMNILSTEIESEAAIKLLKKPQENDEGYTLTISPKHGITIEANCGRAIFYGLQSLFQLIDANGVDNLPLVTINDQPRFAYRGFMLDVSRHFASKEFIKNQINVMAFYKLNYFHWHLTDGAGWRMEIKKYPELTSRAAWRPIEDYQTWIDSGKPFCTADHPTAYGGFYTQADIKEVIEYASERFITIIPEIEMPSHSEEVLNAYPHLSCSGKAGENAEFCIGNEETFTFIQDVLTEVVGLFPSQYIHVGGDEADKSAWKKCAKCQKRIKDERLRNEDQLQSYMMHRVEKFLNAHGRDMLGWDEIAEGGLAPNAIVMSWRGTAGGVKAAQAGHRVIMTPNEYCYFDSYQDAPPTQVPAMSGYLPVDKVYAFDPLTDKLKDMEDKLLGVQANLWTEWISTDEHRNTMIYPRLLAMAEVGWTIPERKNIDSFRKRVEGASKYLKFRGIKPFDIAQEQGARKESKATIKHLALDKTVRYKNPYHPKYQSAGSKALTDGKQANWNHSDGVWQGFLNVDLDVTIDLGKPTKIHSIKANFMQEHHAWIWLPAEVDIYASKDNVNFELLKKQTNDLPTAESGYHLVAFDWQGNTEAQYIRYHAKNSGIDGGWLFTDEIIVE